MTWRLRAHILVGLSRIRGQPVFGATLAVSCHAVIASTALHAAVRPHAKNSPGPPATLNAPGRERLCFGQQATDTDVPEA
jgi:hypothetical protein